MKLKRKRFPRQPLGKNTEFSDFAAIVKKADAYGGVMILFDEDGYSVFTYQRPSKKKYLDVVIAWLEAKWCELIESFDRQEDNGHGN